MSRPHKQGLNNFLIETKDSKEMVMIEAECGMIGFAAVVKLYQRIFKEGFFCKWEDAHKLLFAKDNGISYDVLDDIVTSCIKWKIFDKDMLSTHHILTSVLIQKQFFKKIRESKRVKTYFVKEFLLVKPEKTKALREMPIDGKKPSSKQTVNIATVNSLPDLSRVVKKFGREAGETIEAWIESKQSDTSSGEVFEKIINGLIKSDVKNFIGYCDRIYESERKI
jgi:hypothetical protein